MLGNSEVVATIAVKDMQKAMDFYTQTLGMKLDQEVPGGSILKSGSSKLFVYPSAYAGTNQATCASWLCEDIEGLVNELETKGVVFEQYDDLPEVKREGVIHTWGDLKAVWFKDPDGNILNVTNQM